MKHDTDETGLPERPPPVAAEIFGNRLPIAEHFAHLLAETGVSHGLIGPRETPRLWDRHLLNCGAVESVLPHRTRVVDVGSGAGLPGLVLAIARPDLDLVLVEPMLRRTTWLETAVGELSLGNVQVLRGRAQEFWGKLRAPVVTARAVARIGELSAWCLPLLDGDGRLLALKGASAERELGEDELAVRRAGGVASQLIVLGEDVLPKPTRLLEVRIGRTPVRPTEPAHQGGRSAKRRRKTATKGRQAPSEPVAAARRGSTEPGTPGR